MKINYSEKRIRDNFIHGLLMVAIGLTVFIWSGKATIGYFWIFFGVLQLATAWFFRNNPYISVEDNKLTKNTLFRKTIDIDDIRKEWKYVNSYKIETSDQTLTIDKNTIETASLYLLSDFLNELEIKDFGMERS